MTSAPRTSATLRAFRVKLRDDHYERLVRRATNLKQDPRIIASEMLERAIARARWDDTPRHAA
jgi:hypothetical protein